MSASAPRGLDAFWGPLVGRPDGGWPGGDLLAALVAKFLGRIDVVDAEALAAVAGGPCLYVANHQVVVESLAFVLAVSPVAGTRPIAALAKSDHRQGWLGRLVELCFAYPGVHDPGLFLYFDRQNPDVEELFGALERHVAATGASVLVHVEGTRRRSARTPVKRLSPLWIELALRNQWPLVPVRFIGGLPVEDPEVRQDVPVGCGTQTIRVGRPILPAELAGKSEAGKLTRVRAAINQLSDARTEVPDLPDEIFAARARRWSELTGVDATTAAVFCALERQPSATLALLVDAGRRVLDGETGVAINLGAGPEADWLAGVGELLFGTRGPAIVR